MARDISDSFRGELTADGGYSPIILLEIHHADLREPIRVVNDNQDFLHNGETYQAFRFEVALPNDEQNQLPQATLLMDNVGGELTRWLYETRGGLGASAVIKQVTRDAPDDVEIEYSLNLSNVKVSSTRVSGKLSFENVLNTPAVRVRYQTDTAPGLF